MHAADRSRSEGELKLIARVRKQTARLPEVAVSVDGFGHTTFKVGRRSIALIGAGEGSGSLSIKATPETQRNLIGRGPWFRTPFIGQHGWVTAWGDAVLDWEEIDDLLEDAYRLAAPKRLIKQLDQNH